MTEEINRWDLSRMKKDTNQYISPSGKYKLVVSYYDQGEGYWDYSRGIVTEISTNKIIADIKRNYGSFWHYWVEHSNGQEYLLCGENYQGYNIIDFTYGGNNAYVAPIKHTFFNKLGVLQSMSVGWCWVDVLGYDKETNLLKVSGCYWAAPFEIVTFDFSNPKDLPLKIVSREYEEIEDDDLSI